MTTKCYVIGMKYPTEIMETLKKSELDPIWVEGVDAKKMSDEDIKKEVTSFYSGFGPKSTIGCALAHIKTWEKIAKGDEPYSIVFEDDVVLEPNFLKSYKNAMEKVPKDFDYLQLGYFKFNPIVNVIFLPSAGFSLFGRKEEVVNDTIVKPNITLATHAYVISKEGAKKFLDLIKGKINNHIDYMIMNLHIKDKIKVYALKDRIAYQTSTENFDSLNASSYPFLLNKLVSCFSVDKMVRMNYIFSVNFARLGSININAWTCFILAFGIIGMILNINIIALTIFFVAISIVEIVTFKNLDLVFFTYFIFILPSLIKLLVNLNKTGQ